MASFARVRAAASSVWWAGSLVLRGSPAGRLIDRFLGAGEAEAMREIAGKLLAGERGQTAPELGLAEQQQAEAATRRHVVPGISYSRAAFSRKRVWSERSPAGR